MDVGNEAACYRVPALERGLRLLHLFNGYPTGISAAEAARELHLPRASVYRIVKTLEFMGYLRLADRGSYVLGPAALRIGVASSDESAAQTGLPDLPHTGAAMCERAGHASARLSPAQVHDGYQREKLADVP